MPEEIYAGSMDDVPPAMMSRAVWRLSLVWRYLRTAVWRWGYGYRDVHPTVLLVRGSRISKDVVIGPYGFINYGCHICPRVRIGAYALFGPRVAIVGGDHLMDRPGVSMQFSGRPEVQETIIEDDVWVGFGAIVIAGVRIGRGSVIAAGAVVANDVPPFEVHGGVPARKIRDRFPDPQDRSTHEAMLDGPLREGFYAGPQKVTR